MHAVASTTPLGCHATCTTWSRVPRKEGRKEGITVTMLSGFGHFFFPLQHINRTASENAIREVRICQNATTNKRTESFLEHDKTKILNRSYRNQCKCSGARAQTLNSLGILLSSLRYSQAGKQPKTRRDTHTTYRRLVSLDELAHVPVTPLRPIQAAHGDRLRAAPNRKFRSCRQNIPIGTPSYK